MAGKLHSKITFLSGGTGTPKLLLGMRKFISDEQISIIGNTGDDDYFYGLLISPDIDTLIYLFSNKLDLDKFWGVKEESFNVLNEIEQMGGDTWFKLGDKDLALHLIRNDLLKKGMNLSNVIAEISRRLAIQAIIIPMSNEAVRTTFHTKSKERLSFQEYTVKFRAMKEITTVSYAGAESASATKEAIELILRSKVIVIGPSNPITSIGPILAIEDIREALINTKAKIIAISPIQQGRAFSGPVIQLMKELNLEPTSAGIAKLYKDFLDGIVISDNDSQQNETIKNMGIEVFNTNISLQTDEEREFLATRVLEYAKSL